MADSVGKALPLFMLYCKMWGALPFRSVSYVFAQKKKDYPDTDLFLILHCLLYLKRSTNFLYNKSIIFIGTFILLLQKGKGTKLVLMTHLFPLRLQNIWKCFSNRLDPEPAILFTPVHIFDNGRNTVECHCFDLELWNCRFLQYYSPRNTYGMCFTLHKASWHSEIDFLWEFPCFEKQSYSATAIAFHLVVITKLLTSSTEICAWCLVPGKSDGE